MIRRGGRGGLGKRAEIVVMEVEFLYYSMIDEKQFSDKLDG